MSDFDEIVDGAELSADETSRLRRVHELLVEAGPPADLPPSLACAGRPAEAQVVDFTLLPRRRRRAAAASPPLAVAAVGVGGGYLLGHAHAKTAVFATRRVVPMQGKGALAVLRIGRQDKAGNWPMQLLVSGLPTQRDPRGLLRAVADEGRKARRSLRLVPRQRREDDGAPLGALLRSRASTAGS